MSWKVKNKEEAQEIMSLSLLVGQLLLQNGAEIYRAEDTIQRMCATRKNLYDIDVFGLTSALFLSLEYDYETITMLKTVGESSVNLEKIVDLNQFSRRFVEEEISVAEGRATLLELSKKPPRPLFIRAAAAGMASAFFSILFNGTAADFLMSFFISLFVYLSITFFSEKKLSFFIDAFLGAFLSSGLALLGVILNLGNHLDKTIISVIMILVPGVAITNAVRDIMSGDFLSGLIGLTKAIFVALAIALGVGVVLNYRMWRGFL